MDAHSSGLQTAALIGSYVPRQCGIATFTKDLRDAITDHGSVRTLVIALDDKLAGYSYPEEVRFEVQANRLADYQAAADLLNINQIDIAIVQHEFGIFGGRTGEHVLALMRNLRMPVITTLHTVLAEPDREHLAVMQELVSLSDRLVVMCNRAVRILQEVYNVPKAKTILIPHGIPDVPFVDPAFYKDQFHLEGHRTLLTFGLLSPGKGIELVIEALPKIVEQHPDVMYVILGAIHPHVFKVDGNAYLATLELLAEKRRVREHVIFHNRYVMLPELCRYIGAADLFVTPYRNRDQIVSGALAYAMGAGKAVLSTPYPYAEEMLADNRGRMFPFGDAEALAAAVNELLDDPVGCAAMRKWAYTHCRPMVWKEVGCRYVELGAEVLMQRLLKPRPVFHLRVAQPTPLVFAEPDIRHLHTLTDDTGILQHATYSIPDRSYGYSADDNARALVAAMLYLDITGDDSILPLARTYLAFLCHAFNQEHKRFRNFLTYDRRWQEDVGSEDVHGRAIWALGLTAAHAPNDSVLALTSRLLCDALETVETLQSPRSWAFALVGIHAYLKRFSGDAYVRRIRENLARRLYERFQKNSSADWPWSEDTVTYDNGKLPHALILAGQWLPDMGMLEQGMLSLEWLVCRQINEHDKVSLIGNQGWLARSGKRARFDQQPIEAMSMVEACAEAYRYTRATEWSKRAQMMLGWFLGNNDTESMLYDSATGGCRDGLHADGPNLNEGAESTLAWLISLLTVNELQQEVQTGIHRDFLEMPPKL